MDIKNPSKRPPPSHTHTHTHTHKHQLFNSIPNELNWKISGIESGMWMLGRDSQRSLSAEGGLWEPVDTKGRFNGRWILFGDFLGFSGGPPRSSSLRVCVSMCVCVYIRHQLSIERRQKSTNNLDEMNSAGGEEEEGEEEE